VEQKKKKKKKNQKKQKNFPHMVWFSDSVGRRATNNAQLCVVLLRIPSNSHRLQAACSCTCR